MRVNTCLVEKEVNAIVARVADAIDKDMSKEEAVQRVTSLVSRLQGLKRKVYNNILEYTNNREGAILHPMKDTDIVRPDMQLDTGRMIGHLIWEIALHNLEENWTVEVEKKLGSIIWCHLFKDRNEVGKALREGFYLAINTTPIEKTSDIALLTPDCLKISFSGSCSIDPEKFMSAVLFEDTINEVQQEWFTKAIYEMSNAERM